MATQPDQLSRSIASRVSRAVERAVDQALASLPSLPGNSGFAAATQEVCNIDVSGGGGGVLPYITCTGICAAQRGRDFEAPDLGGVSISEAFSRTGYKKIVDHGFIFCLKLLLIMKKHLFDV